MLKLITWSSSRFARPISAREGFCAGAAPAGAAAAARAAPPAAAPRPARTVRRAGATAMGALLGSVSGPRPTVTPNSEVTRGFAHFRAGLHRVDARRPWSSWHRRRAADARRGARRAADAPSWVCGQVPAASAVEVLDGVVGLLLGELVPVLGGELVADRLGR